MRPTNLRPHRAVRWILVPFVAACAGDGGGASKPPAPDSAVADGAYVVINEVVARAAEGGPDWFELTNVGDAAGQAFYCAQSFDVAPSEYVLVQSHDDCVVELGESDSVEIYPADGTTHDTGAPVLDSVSWDAGESPEGGSYGRVPDGTGEFFTLLEPTPGARNVTDLVQAVCGNGVRETGEVCDGSDLGGETCEALGFESGEITCAGDCLGRDYQSCAPYASDVVLNEVDRGDEFVELVTTGADTPIEGWSLVDRVAPAPERAYTFSAGETVSVGEYVVVNEANLPFRVSGGEPVVLRDADGKVRDHAVGDTCRVPDGTGT